MAYIEKTNAGGEGSERDTEKRGRKNMCEDGETHTHTKRAIEMEAEIRTSVLRAD